MPSVVKSAKTVDEAVEMALEELQVRRDVVDVQVLEKPSKGLFGLLGAKPAIVRVSLDKEPTEITMAFLKDICSSISTGVSVDIESEDEHEFVLSVQGDNLGLIIGRRGETLNAIQYLTTLVYNKYLGSYKRVLVNAGNYRERREDTLRSLAERLAEKAISNQRKVALEPMNAYERRIIHTTLQGVNGVDTYSEGDEPYRKVIIAPKK